MCPTRSAGPIRIPTPSEFYRVGTPRRATAAISVPNHFAPTVDWSFKYLFATEQGKPNLIGFLNLLLMPESPIVDLTYMNSGSIPISKEEKSCLFDILCKDEAGDQYLIEMQNGKVGNIKERIIYYSCLMNFTFESNPKLRRNIQLYDIDDREIFSDKLNIIILQLPCLKAETIGQCNKYYEYLLYLLNQMQRSMKTIAQLKD